MVAATSSPELHERIFRQAQRDGILCNCVDEPDRCDFYYPAVVRRGPLQIAISTSGQAPILAQRIREEDGTAVRAGVRRLGREEVGRARANALGREISPVERMSLLRELSSENAFQEFRAKTATAGKDPA